MEAVCSFEMLVFSKTTPYSGVALVSKVLLALMVYFKELLSLKEG
jgi:hypothetical protein